MLNFDVYTESNTGVSFSLEFNPLRMKKRGSKPTKIDVLASFYPYSDIKKTLIALYQSRSFNMVIRQRLELWTHWLRVSCSTNWASGPVLVIISKYIMKVNKIIHFSNIRLDLFYLLCKMVVSMKIQLKLYLFLLI